MALFSYDQNLQLSHDIEHVGVRLPKAIKLKHLDFQKWDNSLLINQICW